MLSSGAIAAGLCPAPSNRSRQPMACAPCWNFQRVGDATLFRRGGFPAGPSGSRSMAAKTKTAGKARRRLRRDPARLHKEIGEIFHASLIL